MPDNYRQVSDFYDVCVLTNIRGFLGLKYETFLNTGNLIREVYVQKKQIFNKQFSVFRFPSSVLCLLLSAFCFLLSIFCLPAYANDIAVDNVSLVDEETEGDTYDIQFDLAWDNSWFITGAPSAVANWDAAWVFAKFSVYSAGSWSDWAHCTLLNTGSTAPEGSQISFGITDAAYKGAFIYRSAAGTGSVDWDDAEIRWDYGADLVADGAVVQVEVFAIEMVYIPTCNFYAGDGTDRTGGSNSHFFDAADAVDPRDPVQITVTQPYISNVNDGTGTAGYITWVNESGNAGNLPAVETQLGANYPSGYNAFYIMKYETSQRQYCEFLNTLDATQQNNRHDAALHFNVNRNFIKKTSSSPAFFGCDAGNDAGAATSATKANLNEDDDGEWAACNYLSWIDVAAYADWAALRPFTELEFEKACRGGQAALASEYAWGTATVATLAYVLDVNADTTSEGIGTNYSTTAGNCSYSTTDGSINGPLRVGIFSAHANNTGRMTSGAGYYGIMELSGNLWERPVSVMDSKTGTTVSTFNGTHGDGTLSSTGFATNADWPGTDAQGCGYRGGTWDYVASHARVSARSYAADAFTYRYIRYGGRCARTSP